MTYAFILCMTLTSFADSDERKWVEVIRDGLTTNQSALEHGSTTMEIEYEHGDGTKVIIHCDVKWSGQKSLLRFKLHGPPFAVLGRQETSKPLADQDYDIILNNGRQVYWYVPSQKTVNIDDRTSQTPLDTVLHLTPQDLWLKCCFPAGRYGNPWPETVGWKSLGPSDADASLNIIKEGDLIKQTRNDYDGGILETVFSLRAGCNVVARSYHHPDSTKGYLKSSYTWIKQNSAYVPEKFELEQKFGDDDMKMLGLTDIMRYRMVSRNTSLSPIDEKTFDPRAFLKGLPDEALVVNHGSNAVKRLRPAAAPSEATFKDLSEKLKPPADKP